MAWFWGRSSKRKKPNKAAQNYPEIPSPLLVAGLNGGARESSLLLSAMSSEGADRLAQLPDRVKTELFQIAQQRRVVAGESVSIEPGYFCINLDTPIQVVLVHADNVAHRVEPVACIGPIMLQQLVQFDLQAEMDGQLLFLSSSLYSAASDALREFVSSLALEFDHHLVSSLLIRSHALEQRNQQLSDRVFEQAEQTRARFIETDMVKKVISRIPRLPVATLQLLTMLRDPDSSAKEVTELVLQDPSLGALLLKTINSPQYNLQTPITDLYRATVLLGYEGVHQLVMAGSFKKCMPNNELFRESYACAIEVSHLAFALAKLSGRANPNEMSTVGLLHDVGLIVAQLLDRNFPDFKGIIALVDQGELGGELLRSWTLPESVFMTVRQQNYPEFSALDKIDKVNLDRVTLLFLARQLHRQMLRKQPVEHSIFINEYLAHLGWENKTLEQLWSHSVVPLLRNRKNALPQSMRDL